MRFGNLHRGEIVAMVGGLVLALGLFLAWYQLGNQNTTLDDFQGPDTTVSAWQALTNLRFLLLLAALAPFILAYIVVREHALSWPRGELTAVVGLTAVTLVLIRGFILKPGEPASQISLQFGYFVALLGAGLILLGAVTSQAQSGTSDRPRKPPGVM